MKLEWSDAALADIDRFVEFLDREHPSLAGIVADEILRKVQALSEHPMLGRPISGRPGIPSDGDAGAGGSLHFPISFRCGKRLVMLRVFHSREARQ